MTTYTVFAKKPHDAMMRYEAEAESHTEAIAMVKKEHPDSTVLAYLSTAAGGRKLTKAQA